MHKELITIKLIRKYLVESKIINENIDNINDIYEYFKFISSNNNQFSSLYILNYIQEYICSENISKKKTSARVFVDLISIIFNGNITDDISRVNDTLNVPNYFDNVKDKIAGNKREKINIQFPKFGISVKTLIPNNKEINLGSFEKNILFDALDVSNYLFERKSNNNLGLGSKPLLNNLLEYINKNKKYDLFVEKFNAMVKYIFSDDMLIAIKDNYKMALYFFTGQEFINFFITSSSEIKNLLKIVNRWEGNSIRVDRTLILDNCSKKLELDLKILNNSIIKKINQFDIKLHNSYVKYIYMKENRLKIKNNIFRDLSDIFNEFDYNINLLL